MFTPVQVIFYIFAVVAICSGIAVITARHPVRSVLSLVMTFFAMAGIWMLLRAEFLSLILLLVYVGAVMTLFLFVVMMLNVVKETRHSGFVYYLPFGILIVLLMISLIIITVGSSYFWAIQMPIPLPEPAHYSNIQQLGEVLYTDYAYPFEIGGVILLVAIIAAIALTHRGPVRRKVQSVGDQVNIDPNDRVRLIKMPAEKRKK
ncbi:MAG TPA: NADH-quinone oxidoreductase subunit J [Gammaproteobacteria bacterium]|nr:NADH-quinone oxidoreductase subunit J [Gammaproteobacteria bacterium]